MATPKNPDLVKKTLNIREGDFEKMAALFPRTSPSIAIRELISAFVNKHYGQPNTEGLDVSDDLEL